mmetsp:Transcript_28874/g.58607  ORF Transcript_28874/g.58607 Transcript_28874/m.58607 type:complete len:286 (+) Transcript_28874:176-1033(+)
MEFVSPFLFQSYSSPDEVSKFLDDNGNIKSSFMTVCERFAEFLDKQDDMTLSIVSNAFSWLARELNDQLYLAGQPSTMYVRRVTEVKRTEDKYKKHRFDPVVVTAGGELQFKDIHTNIDCPIAMIKRLDGARVLLNDNLGGAGSLYALNTHYEFNVTHAVATRGEDIRAENVACSFVRKVLTVGQNGTYGLFFMSNGGKTNAKGRLVYFGSIPHKNPLLCAIAAKGRVYMYRWNAEYGQSERNPDFLDPQDYYLMHVCRPDISKGRHEKTEYEVQRKNFKSLLED